MKEIRKLFISKDKASQKGLFNESKIYNVLIFDTTILQYTIGDRVKNTSNLNGYSAIFLFGGGGELKRHGCQNI